MYKKIREEITVAKARERQPRRPGITKKKIIIFVILIVVVGAACFGYNAVKSKKQVVGTATDVSTERVERGDVSLTITGSAAVEPYERYEIIAKVSGDITYCPYEVGDMVEKDTVLYRFDTSATDISMQKQQISLEQSQDNYQKALKDVSKLEITAGASGVISNISLSVGDEIKNGEKLADISNTQTLEVSLPFNEVQASNINIGDTAYVSSSVHMSNVPGTVTHKDASSHAGSDGSRLYNVTITFENPGAFYEGLKVGGAVGDMISSGSGEVMLSDSGSALAETDGEITQINYKNGDYVEKGSVVAVISSDTVTDSINSSRSNYENAELSMRDAQEQLEDYSLTSPISGTVITKNAKAGDTIDKTNSTQTLMVVADVSKLKFNLEIDELDVSKVTTGQKVEITCDALENEVYEGEITNLSVEGTSTNGVTTYTAEVVINEPGNLRPSMNVDASVVVESSQNTLYVPSEAVKTIGNMYYVFRKTGSSDTNSKTAGEKPQIDGERPESMPDQAKETETEQNADKNQGTTDGARQPGGERQLPQAPDGFETVVITVGVVGDENTEILSGLSEGDEVYSETSSSSSDGRQMGMGGMVGGGMPSGGGGMPGGGGGGPMR